MNEGVRTGFERVLNIRSLTIGVTENDHDREAKSGSW
jgi:hypothetical protein